MNELNSSSYRHCDEIVLNITSQVRLLQNEIYANTSNIISNNRQNVDSLTAQLISDIQALRVFNSCAAIMNLSLPFSSGLYWVKSTEHYLVQVNCTSLSYDNRRGWWRRTAYLNTSDSNPVQCPSGLEARNEPPLCRHALSTAGCSSANYRSNNISYSRIYGGIVARYSGSPDGFQHFGGNRNNPTLEDNYVDGVSLTYGMNNRTHIWTFAASVNARYGECIFCERERPSYCNLDQLWDGDQCIGNATFYRQLPHATTGDIEMRVCRGQDRQDEDILLTFIEIFLQ